MTGRAEVSEGPVEHGRPEQPETSEVRPAGATESTAPGTSEVPGAGAAEGPGAEGPIVVSPSVYRRLMSGLPGYLVAMLACLSIVGLVILLTPRRNPDAVPRIDYGADLAGLVAVAPYTAQAPEGLPATWYPTSSRLSGRANGPVAWHLGFYTPLKKYAALEESNEAPGGPAGFVSRMTSAGRPDGTVQIAGATWEKTYRVDKEQRSLVRRLPGLTLVVTGTAGYDELTTLAAALQPHPRAGAR